MYSSNMLWVNLNNPSSFNYCYNFIQAKIDLNSSLPWDHIQARTIDFDVNFMNFEDPEVLQRFVGRDMKKHWKDTYGFDWASQEIKIGTVLSSKYLQNMYKWLSGEVV